MAVEDGVVGKFALTQAAGEMEFVVAVAAAVAVAVAVAENALAEEKQGALTVVSVLVDMPVVLVDAVVVGGDGHMDIAGVGPDEVLRVKLAQRVGYIWMDLACMRNRSVLAGHG